MLAVLNLNKKTKTGVVLSLMYIFFTLFIRKIYLTSDIDTWRLFNSFKVYSA